MIYIVGIIVVAIIGFFILGSMGNSKQKSFESRALQQLASNGNIFTKQTKTDYGIIAIDEAKRKLFLINSELTNQEQVEIDFEDIYSCELIVDSQSVFRKSTARTILGSAIGGSAFGETGAVIGGLSGSYKEHKNIKQIDLKIVVKSISNPTRKFKFYGSGTNSGFLSMRIKEAEEWKDTIAIIIDDVDSRSKQS